MNLERLKLEDFLTEEKFLILINYLKKHQFVEFDYLLTRSHKKKYMFPKRFHVFWNLPYPF